MPQMPWNSKKKLQFNQQTGQAVLDAEHALVSYRQDFGKIHTSRPFGLITPKTPDDCQKLFHFANAEQLPITIRGGGLSQSGQSLANEGGMMVSMAAINQVLDIEQDTIWVEGAATWQDLIHKTLPQKLVPYVVPYNTQLSIAGVISAGGVGSSAFKHGAIVHHIEALEVVLPSGSLQVLDKQSPLFQAFLGGQGRCGAITKVKVKLRRCLPQTRTFYFAYDTLNDLLSDFIEIKDKIDYAELFASPAIMGTKINNGRRTPFASWHYAMQVTFEYDKTAPDLSVLALSKPMYLYTQDTPLEEYLFRHVGRFEMMKATGLWDLTHPWYECFLSLETAMRVLSDLLPTLPLHFANMVQFAPILNPAPAGMFILPDAPMICSMMILNPGVHPVLLPSCLEAIARLDEVLLKQGGKRYLSGYLGQNIDKGYWMSHFGEKYDDWVALKQRCDPTNIISSKLFS